MTFDDLEFIFQRARKGSRNWDGTEWVGVYGGDKAGIRAVLIALREEIVPTYWRLNDLSAVQASDLRRFFNELVDKEAVLDDASCQSSEQRMPETTPKGEQRD